MSIAQKLYESGLISYMRTDSLNLSDDAIQGATKEIKKDYGEEYIKVRKYKTKTSGAQEAHEAIRPTDFSLINPKLDRNGQRLYELIWKRAIASQMEDAQIEKTTATIDISTTEESFIATGEVIKFDGFLSVYLESTDEDEGEEQKGMLPPLTVGEKLTVVEIKGREGFTRHPARYSEASLVKKLEEMGIGRPSTYAPTISTIQKRNYVEKESREGKERSYHMLLLKGDQVVEEMQTEITGTEKNKLFPTNIAMVVTDFLVDHFPNVTNYSFTAEVEKEFDEIAQGHKEWNQMIDTFYKDFHSKVESTESIERSDVPKSHTIGKDPKTGKTIVARLGKFGPLVQLGEDDDPDKKFASLRHGQFIESITLEDALDLFKMPRDMGEYEGKPVQIGIGRFGPYVKHEGKYTSIPKEEDPFSITMERAIELIEEKRKADENKYIKLFSENEDVQVLNGRYGPYIKVGKKNVKIPKDKKPEELTLAECLDLAEKTPAKKGRGRKK
jgi:DNA topoisomerase-1